MKSTILLNVLGMLTKHSKELKIQVIKEAMETGKTSVVAVGSRVQRPQICDVDVTTVPDLDFRQLPNENDKLK